MSSSDPDHDGSLAHDLHVQATYRLTEALVASENRMRRRIDLLSEVVFETDAEGRFIFLNQAWTRCLGHPVEHAIGLRAAQFVVPADQPRYESVIRRAALSAPGERQPLRLRRANGSVAWMEISVTPLADGGIVGALHDVSAIHRAESEVVKLSLVASETDNLVIITDRDGLTEWVNDSFVRRTGYTLQDLIGLKPGKLLQGPDTDPETIEHIRRGVSAGRAVEAEILNYSKSGEAYWVRLHITPIRDSTGAVERFVSVQADSTEQRRIQHELELAKEKAEHLAAQAQASNRAKDQFLAVMSHEIRTPMNAILGFATVLADTPLTAQQSEFLSIISKSGESLLGIINEILDFSKIESGTFEIQPGPTGIRSLVTAALATCRPATSKPLELGFTLDPATPATVTIDAKRVRQVLVNLIGNAVKFTPAGRVDVFVGPDLPRQAGESRLRFIVSDTGIGIAEKDLVRIFQPFCQADASTTRKYGGTGLGLAICHSLVGLMGGTIEVESTLGCGSKFTFSIRTADTPALPASDEPPAPRMLPLSADERALRILVVEDDETNLALVLQLLAKIGLRADSVGDGLACLNTMQSRNYDLVFMDLRMPELDGIETTRELRRGSGESPPFVCALTANIIAIERERFLAAGADLVLAKPVQITELRAAIHRAAHGSRPTFLAAHS
jgi:two-component system sensor histidine kinase/response regulator